MKSQVKLKKGRYVLCRYHGDNGDLIVGTVDSVRLNGDIICMNLITGKRHTKKVGVFKARNVLVTKHDALQVVDVFEAKKSKQAARLKAVELAAAYITKVKRRMIVESPAAVNDNRLEDLRKSIAVTYCELAEHMMRAMDSLDSARCALNDFAKLNGFKK